LDFEKEEKKFSQNSQTYAEEEKEVLAEFAD
jgi:hypothetical protein